MQWRPRGSERGSDLPQITQEVSGRARPRGSSFLPWDLSLAPKSPTLLNSYILFQAGSSIRPCCPHDKLHTSLYQVEFSGCGLPEGRAQGPFTRSPMLRAQAPELLRCGRQSCKAFVTINLRASDPGLLVRPLGPRPHSPLITQWGGQSHSAPRRDC